MSKEKQKILIIDGHDKTGKSTIARALSAKIGIPVFKRYNVRDHYDFVIDLFYSVESYLQFLEQTGYSVIFDRLHPSEYAYSKVLGRMTSLEKILEIDKRFSKLGTKIILCSKSKDKYLEDEIIDIKKYDAINGLLQEFGAVMTDCPVLFLDTSDGDLETQLEQIIKFIQ